LPSKFSSPKFSYIFNSIQELNKTVINLKLAINFIKLAIFFKKSLDIKTCEKKKYQN